MQVAKAPMSEENSFDEIDALIAEQERLAVSPPMVCVRDIRSIVEANKTKEDDTVRVTMCVDTIEEHPKLWHFNFVDAALSIHMTVLKPRTKSIVRNNVIFRVTLWNLRKRPLGGVYYPSKVGDM